QEQRGVVELADLLKEIDQPADLGVSVIEETGECFLQAQCKLLLVVGETVPRLDPGIARRELGVRRNDAELLLPLEPVLAHLVPTGIEAAFVFVDVFSWRLMRRVGRAEAEIEKERPLRDGRLLVADEADAAVDQIFGEMITLLRRL